MKFGLIWGTVMFLTMTIAFPLWDSKELNPLKIIISIPFFIAAGLMVGYISRKKEPKKQIDN